MVTGVGVPILTVVTLVVVVVAIITGTMLAGMSTATIAAIGMSVPRRQCGRRAIAGTTNRPCIARRPAMAMVHAIIIRG